MVVISWRRPEKKASYILISYLLLSSYLTSGKDIVATLPAGVAGADVTWVGIWCRKFSKDFGHVWLIPEDQVPASASASVKSVSIIVVLSILFVLFQ